MCYHHVVVTRTTAHWIPLVSYTHLRPKILALTATLNPKEVVDICTEFNISKENIIRDNLLMRSEISLKVLKFIDENEKEDKLWEIIKIHKGEKILVYVYRIASERGVEMCIRDRSY